MSYKDTEFKQVCPYNCFNECFYEVCPFFTYEKGQDVITDFSPMKYGQRPTHTYKTYIKSIGCRKVEAEIRASRHEPDNIEVNVNNHTAVRSSIF